MVDAAAFLVASGVILFPGYLAVSAFFPRLTVDERFALGASAGLAGAMVLAVGLGHVSLGLFYPAWAVLGIASAVAWLRGRRGPVSPAAMPDGTGCWLLLVLALVATSRFAVTRSHVLPPGWDPSFHLLLAKKIDLTRRMIFDWTPFEDIPLNYPVGSHFLLVLLSDVSRLPLHTAFQLLSVILGVLETALVFAMGRRVSGSSDIALFAGLAFGLWADYGSIGYYAWGGLPNELAMCLLLGMLVLLAGQDVGTRVTALVAVLWAGILVSHHHVMIVTAGIMGALALRDRIRAPERGRHVAVLAAAAGAVLLSSFHVIPYLLKARTLRSTFVWRFEEEFFDPARIVVSLGVVFSAAVGLGWILHLFQRRTRFDPILSCALLTLAVLFVLFEYVYRALSLRLWGREYVALTPSRFLTDATCLLAIYAGTLLARVRAWLAWARAPAVLVAVGLGLSLLPRWKELATAEVVPGGYLEAGAWIQENTPPETIVLNCEPWASYVTWRRNPGSPLPISEPIDLATARREIEVMLRAGRGSSAPRLVAIVWNPPTDSRTRILWRHPSGFAVAEYGS